MAYDALIDKAKEIAQRKTLADHIRAKGGTAEQLTWPAGFLSAVDAIPTGGGALPGYSRVITETVTIPETGTFSKLTTDVTFDLAGLQGVIVLPITTAPIPKNVTFFAIVGLNQIDMTPTGSNNGEPGVWEYFPLSLSSDGAAYTNLDVIANIIITPNKITIENSQYSSFPCVFQNGVTYAIMYLFR